MKKLTAWYAIAGLLVVLVACGNSSDDIPTPPEVEAEIAERLAPAGTITLASNVSSAPAASAGAARSGGDVYNSKCMICHASGTAGAPKIGSPDDWAPRLENGLDALYSNAINGLNGMPAKGLCMDCSDDELKASVDYMLENSK